MKHAILIFALSLCLLPTLQAQDAEIITRWIFDDTLAPETGQGTASLIGGTSTHSTTANNGWRITTFPDQFEGSGTAGAEFMLSTSGMSGISVSFGHRSSGTMSRWASFQYTTDGGTTWQEIRNNNGELTPHDTVFDVEVDLSSVAAVSNNPDFGFRVVSIFAPVAFNPEEPDTEFEANTAYQRARTPGSGGNAYSGEGNWRLLNVTFTGTPITGTSVEVTEQPTLFSLDQNYPNPFNPTTTIPFRLTETSDIRLDVFTMTGQRVTTLAAGVHAAGAHTVSFNAGALPSGIYMYRLETSAGVLTRTMVLVK